MDEAEKQRAEDRFQEALRASGARDPRDFYRRSLRSLREANPEGYERAVAHYQSVLIPAVAAGRADPLRAWRDYGKMLAELTAEGRTVSVDETGRARPYDPQTPLDHLVLHLPRARGAAALLVALPPTLSPAQRATYDLLVKGARSLPDPG